MKERMTYAARIYKDDYGFVAEFPQLDLVTQGKNMNEVLYMATDALETYFLDYAHDESEPPVSDLDIELREGDVYAIISAQVDSMADCEMTTQEVMKQLGVNKQRVSQLRAAGKLSARRIGRDYFHSRADVKALQQSQRKAGRPRKVLAATG